MAHLQEEGRRHAERTQPVKLEIRSAVAFRGVVLPADVALAATRLGLEPSELRAGLGLTRFDGQGWCEVGSRYLLVGVGVG